jgi:hypothetical protein
MTDLDEAINDIGSRLFPEDATTDLSAIGESGLPGYSPPTYVCPGPIGSPPPGVPA